MQGIVSSIFSIILYYFRLYNIIKSAVLEYLEPITNRFDLVDILIVWTIIIIVFSKVYKRYIYAKKHGFRKVFSAWLVSKATSFSFVRNKIEDQLNEFSSKLDADLQKHRDPSKTLELPKQGISEEAIRGKVAKWQKVDYKIYGEKKITGCLYYNEGEKLHTLVKDIAKDYLYVNPLHFDLFPTANQMEGEIISMVKKLYHGDDNACGLITSGGTESIMTAMLAYREWGKKNGIEEAEIVAPVTAHVAFEKAAFYYGMRVKYVPVDLKTGVVDPSDIESALSKETVCIIGSYPNYPYGTCDPIEELAYIAKKHRIGFHTDCCLGGFIAPFLDKFGGSSGRFDFRVEGVTSISVDPHKYGLAPKGVSAVLFKTVQLRNGSIFSYTEWPGGIYSTPTHAGSRGHAPIAGAWVALQSVGYNGYLDKAGKIIEATRRAAKKVSELGDLAVVGNPELGTVSFVSKNKNLSAYDVVDKLKEKGWKTAALQKPAALHLSITNYNLAQIDDFIVSVKWAVAELLKNPPTKKGEMAQIYGSNASLPESIMKEGAKVLLQAMLNP